MVLFPDEVLKKLPNLYETENTNLSLVKVPIKVFLPGTAASWYLIEFSKEENLFWGWVNLGDDHCAELGYISKQELESIEIPPGIKVEQDLYWDTNTTLQEVIEFKKR